MRLFGLGGRQKRRSSSTDVSEAAERSPGAPRCKTSSNDAEQQPLEGQDSANDPAIVAAILESLKAVGPDGAPVNGGAGGMCAASCLLCRNLSQADPEVAGQLRQRRAARLLCSPDGISYFEHSDDEYPLTLPSFKGYPEEVRSQVLGQLCNDYLQAEAEAAGVINCVPGCTPVWVLNTQGDGNCLSHACSLGVWGVHDRDSQLRGAARATMTHPVAGQDIRLRFELQLRQNGIPQEEWAAEWRRELAAFHPAQRMSDRYLSDVHCFALANVLRRPLVLYGGEHAALAGLTGVYLPLLWAPNECCRDPVTMLFWGSHFSVLCTVEGEGPTQPQLLPLCTRDGSLQVRFMSAAEAKQYGGSEGGGGSPLALLQQYMACEALPGPPIWRQPEAAAGPGPEEPQQQSLAAGLPTLPQAGEQHPRPCSSTGRGGDWEPAAAVGVRLSSCPAPQALLHLLETAFVSQTAALCGNASQRRSSRRSLGSGSSWGGSRRSSCSATGLGGGSGGQQGHALPGPLWEGCR